MKVLKLAGAALFLGAVLFLASLLYLSAATPGYDWRFNYISDLGVSSNAFIFNAVLAVIGFMLFAIALVLYKELKDALFALLFAISGLGVAGVGVFPLNVEPMHFISASVAFFFAALTMLRSSKLVMQPRKLAFAFLGLVSLLSIILFQLEITLGLGIGVIEHVIVMPFILWNFLLGIFLLNDKKKVEKL